MERKRICPLFRRTESLSIGIGIGYCDLDCSSATCDGDIEFCERLDGLKIFLQKRIKELESKELGK